MLSADRLDKLPRSTFANEIFFRLVKAHHADGIGIGWGESRFVPDRSCLPDGDQAYCAPYAAASFETAFAEVVVRDRLVALFGLQDE